MVTLLNVHLLEQCYSHCFVTHLFNSWVLTLALPIKDSREAEDAIQGIIDNFSNKNFLTRWMVGH